MGKENEIRVNFYVDVDSWKALRHEAVAHQKTASAILRELIDRHVEAKALKGRAQVHPPKLPRTSKSA